MPSYSSMIGPTAAGPNMEVINVNNILNVKDSRWLQLEVCREYQRNKCIRSDTECKFAHPPVTVEVQNGKVTACYDSIKGRCNREKPPCKYFHPPQHLKDQLLINGRNHLALKNAFMTQIHSISPHGSQLIPGGAIPLQPNSSYVANVPTMASYNPYMTSSPMITMGMPESVVPSIGGVLPQTVVPAHQKLPRMDRIEAFTGMGVHYKRAATAHDKSGLPVYQSTHTNNAAAAAAYQQALMQQLGGQSYVPVTCEYGSGSSSGVLALSPSTVAETNTNAFASPPSSIHTIPASSATSASYSTTSSSIISCGTIDAIASSSSNASVVPTQFVTSSVSSTASVSTQGKSSIQQHYGDPISALPISPVNVLSYANYPFSKGLSHQQIKTPAVSASTIPGLPAGAVSASTIPGLPTVAASASGIPAAAAAFAGGCLPYGVAQNSGLSLGLGGVSPLNVGYSNMPLMHTPQTMTPGLGAYSPAGMHLPSNYSAIGTALPTMFSQQVLYPQSSLYYPQLAALTAPSQQTSPSNGTSERPFKKLKTS